MIKIAGFLGVIICTTALGFKYASNVESHCVMLRNVIKMLEEMQILLEYGVLTKDEIFKKIFLKPKYEIFDNTNLSESLLSQKEKEMLSDFYNQFGLTDLQGQLRYLQIVKSFFAESYDELKNEKSNKCKLYRTSGILSGIFICLILI